jgi:hypothetical protein
MAKKRELTIEEIKRKPVLTTEDIARLSDVGRVRIWQLAKAGRIPAKRVKGYEQWRYYNSKRLLNWCEKKKREQAARPIRQARRVGFTPSRDFPFLNDFWKWDQAVKNGQAVLPPVETLRHDFEPVLRGIIKLCGKDWMRATLRRKLNNLL